MEEYYQGTLDILGAQSGELDQIGDLTSRAAGLVKKGGTVWTSMNLGHMPYYEQKDDRRGSPGIMKTHSTSLGAEKDFGPDAEGDIVFTTGPTRPCWPPESGRLRGLRHHQLLEHQSSGLPATITRLTACPDGVDAQGRLNEILHSHVPYEQGLVHAPEIPEFAICPSSGTGSGSIHWMLNAEIANKLAHPNAKTVDKSAQYLRILTERVQRTRTHFDRIRETTAIMAERVRTGGRWFGKSIEHPGFESEFHVASGIRVVNWGDWDANGKRTSCSSTPSRGLSGRDEAGAGKAGGRRLRGGRRTRLHRRRVLTDA